MHPVLASEAAWLMCEKAVHCDAQVVGQTKQQLLPTNIKCCGEHQLQSLHSSRWLSYALVLLKVSPTVSSLLAGRAGTEQLVDGNFAEAPDM